MSAFLKACQKAGFDPTSFTETPIKTTATALPSTMTPTPTSSGEVYSRTRQPTSQIQSTARPDKSNVARIALVKTTSRTDGLHRAIELLNINPVLNQDVFLKPNFNSADPAPGSTHPELLRALILKLQEMGAQRITLGERSGMGNTRTVMQHLGVFDLAKELDFHTIVLDELESSDWIKIQQNDSHWQQGFAIPKISLESGTLVQTCCLKTHRFGGHFTMSLKNSVGLVPVQIPGENHNYMNELHSSSFQRTMIAEINRAYNPSMVILDGVEAFVDGGPDKGTRVQSGVVLASSDRIAIDAVGVAVLRYFGTTPEVSKGRIFEQEQIARAVELGLGVSAPEMIEIVTDDAESQAFASEIQTVLMS